MLTGQGLAFDCLLKVAAHDALDIPLHYAQSGRNLVHVALGGQKPCVELQHYPENDVVDAQHGTRFYYHAHESSKRPAQEHGHFHLFSHADGGDFTHLVGLSLDQQGNPIRWFTTNCWVTGERWHNAAAVCKALDAYQVQTSGRLAPLARWVSAMVLLFKPQIRQMVWRRDVLMNRHCRGQEWSAFCQNRRFDVISQCSAALPARIAQFQKRGH